MKTLTKSSLITAAAALLGTATGLADDQYLQNRLAMERRAADLNQTTVAVYSDKGLGRAERAGAPDQGVQLQERSNPRGERTFIYAPVR